MHDKKLFVNLEIICLVYKETTQQGHYLMGTYILHVTATNHLQTISLNI